MKLQFKALSITLGLVALLGTCTSAKSGTPDISDVDSNVEKSAEVVPQEIKLGDTQETEEIKDAELEVSEDNQDAGDAEVEATKEIQDAETAEVGVSEDNQDAGDAELEAAKEIQDAETAEIEAPELEAVQESEPVEESSSTEGTLDNRVETKTVKDGVEDVKSQF
jgi:hypothetical protein